MQLKFTPVGGSVEVKLMCQFDSSFSPITDGSESAAAKVPRPSIEPPACCYLICCLAGRVASGSAASGGGGYGGGHRH